MKSVTLTHVADWPSWRSAARALIVDNVPPESVIWQVAGEGGDLFGDLDVQCVGDASQVGCAAQGVSFQVPAQFVDLAEQVVCHQHRERFALLYRVLWRLTHGESRLLQDRGDDDMDRLHKLASAVRRDRHKMTAFVRFKLSPGHAGRADKEHYVAWFEPTHHIVRFTAPFFCRRFANMSWSIVTPELSAHFHEGELMFGAGGQRESTLCAEPMDELWRVYFANIFNPARLCLDAMRSEMPVKYWKNLPEAPLIAALTREAGLRGERMVSASPTEPARYARAVARPGAQARCQARDQARDQARRQGRCQL